MGRASIAPRKVLQKASSDMAGGCERVVRGV